MSANDLEKKKNEKEFYPVECSLCTHAVKFPTKGPNVLAHCPEVTKETQRPNVFLSSLILWTGILRVWQPVEEFFTTNQSMLAPCSTTTKVLPLFCSSGHLECSFGKSSKRFTAKTQKLLAHYKQFEKEK